MAENRWYEEITSLSPYVYGYSAGSAATGKHYLRFLVFPHLELMSC